MRDRLVKEVAHYEEDTATNVARVQGFRDDAQKDAWDVKKARRWKRCWKRLKRPLTRPNRRTRSSRRLA
jgi:hypothetical protein